MPAKTRFEVKLGPATREAFGRTLVELGRENKDVVVVDADLSKSTMTVYFQKEFPDRFFECGIAEANMVGIGAGLASSGKIPFVSSFSCFVMNKGWYTPTQVPLQEQLLSLNVTLLAGLFTCTSGIVPAFVDSLD